TAGSAEKLDACLSLGANHAINYKEGPLAPVVKELTGGKGENIILDFICATYFEQNLKSIAEDGKLIIISTMGGARAENVNLGQILFRRLHIIGTALRSQPVEKKIELTQSFMDFALPRFKDDRLVPVIDSIYDWEEVNEAHARMEKNLN